MNLYPPPIKSLFYAAVVISVPIIIFLLLLLGAIHFGFGSPRKWIEFVQEVKGLKEGIQKSLSGLKELSNNIEILEEKMTPDFTVFSDYTQQYIYKKKIKSIWVLGASLEVTLTDNEYFSRLSKNLEKGIKCRYLCHGDKDDITERGRQLAKRLENNNINYLTERNLSIIWIQPHFIMLPLNIFNADETDSEILISLPYEVESTSGKKCAVLIKNKKAIQICKEKFVKLWRTHKDNELDLIKLAGETI
jgi:hypothetical protein